jgi:hypothetical protein
VLCLDPDVVVSETRQPRLNELLATRPFGLVAPELGGEDAGDERRTTGDGRKLLDNANFFAHTRGFSAHKRRRRGAVTEWKTAGSAGGASRLSRGIPRTWGIRSALFLYYEDRDLSRCYRNANMPVRTTKVISGATIHAPPRKLTGCAPGRWLA